MLKIIEYNGYSSLCRIVYDKLNNTYIETKQFKLK